MRPEAPALSWNIARWSYSELAGAVDVTAAFLRTKGCATRRPGGVAVSQFSRTMSPPTTARLRRAVLSCRSIHTNAHGVLARQMEHCHARLLIGDTAHPEWDAIAGFAQSNGVETVGMAAEDDVDTLSRYLRQMGGTAITLEG